MILIFQILYHIKNGSVGTYASQNAHTKKIHQQESDTAKPFSTRIDQRVPIIVYNDYFA